MATELATKIFYDAVKLEYNELVELYPDFTRAYPLVAKYMSLYKIYDPDLFSEMTKDSGESRRFEDNFEKQALYVKKLLVKNGMSRIEAKKLSNMELEEINKQIKAIKRKEKEIKKQMEREKTTNLKELREELLDFVESI